MQLAVAIALTCLYVGLSLALGGVRPQSGFPWWFFAPFIVMACAGLGASGIMTRLPIPWAKGHGYDPPPRRVRLSWRAAVRLPAYVPALLIPWHFFSIMRLHVDLGWMPYILIALVLAALVRVVRRRGREIRLLRFGEVTPAIVDYREVDTEWADRISYHFTTSRGTRVAARGLYAGYDVHEGSSVPVFYDAVNPRNHVAACAAWFEVD